MVEYQERVMPETWSLENLVHLPEIINDAINGIVAFILYWPFIWLLFQHVTAKIYFQYEMPKRFFQICV